MYNNVRFYASKSKLFNYASINNLRSIGKMFIIEMIHIKFSCFFLNFQQMAKGAFKHHGSKI